jgi:hypothetical protein
MRSPLTIALAALALLLAPCIAATKPAPPMMTITRINGRSTNPLIARVESEVKSFALDAAVAFAMNLQGVDIAPPPPGYDREYSNVEVRDDVPDNADLFGFTEPPARKGGKCIVHTKRLGQATASESGGWVEVFEEVGLMRLLRHEYAHCQHLIHGELVRGPATPDKWSKVAPADREKLTALTHRQWLEITGQRDVAPTPARPAATSDGRTPTPRRGVAPSSPRTFSGGGY